MEPGGMLTPRRPKREPLPELLLRRVTEHGDFPAMSRTVRRVNCLAGSELSSARQLAEAIMEDLGLTKALLKLVNSAAYSQQYEVTTVTRAIVLIGLDSVRSLVLTMKLFDSIPASADLELVKTRLATSFAAGVFARMLARQVVPAKEEEAFISGLFHFFGELLIAYYAPEKMVSIHRLMSTRDVAEERAAFAVLGMSYSVLGASVAQELHFPEAVVASIRGPMLGKTPSPGSRTEIIAAIAALGARASKLLVEQRRPRQEVLTAMVDLLGTFGRDHAVTLPRASAFVDGVLEVLDKQAAAVALPPEPRREVRDSVARYRAEEPSNSGSPLRPLMGPLGR
jgi:HD-like signal output (HDOD) protein